MNGRLSNKSSKELENGFEAVLLCMLNSYFCYCDMRVVQHVPPIAKLLLRNNDCNPESCKHKIACQHRTHKWQTGSIISLPAFPCVSKCRYPLSSQSEALLGGFSG